MVISTCLWNTFYIFLPKSPNQGPTPKVPYVGFITVHDINTNVSFKQIRNFLYRVNAVFILGFPLPGKMVFIWNVSPELFQQCYTLSSPLLPMYGSIDPITSVISLGETVKSTTEDFKLPSNDLIRKTYILHDDFKEGYEGYLEVTLVTEYVYSSTYGDQCGTLCAVSGYRVQYHDNVMSWK